MHEIMHGYDIVVNMVIQGNEEFNNKDIYEE